MGSRFLLTLENLKDIKLERHCVSHFVQLFFSLLHSDLDTELTLFLQKYFTCAGGVLKKNNNGTEMDTEE